MAPPPDDRASAQLALPAGPADPDLRPDMLWTVPRDGAVSGPSGAAVALSLPNPTPAPQQIAQTILHALQKSETGPVELTLRPEELGHLRFDLTTNGDKVHVTLFVERPEALDLIRRHSEQLLNDLRQSGFGQATLSFGDWSRRDGGQDHTSASPLHTPSESHGAALMPDPVPPASRAADGRLDLRL